MTSKSEALKRKIIESGSPLQRRTSLNQRNLGRQVDIEGKVFGETNIKAAKAEARKQKFIRQLPRQQFDRSLGHMLNGGATNEEIVYVLEQIGRYEKPLGNNGYEVTIVDFVRSAAE